MMTKSRERWEKEAAFFDLVAQKEGQKVLPIDPLALRRYGAAFPRKRFNKEFRFHVLGDLNGKQMLDVGCGDGSNSILLAKLGARVTGIDISPNAIELARRNAQISGVKNTVRFICSPLEIAELPPNHFDLIWGDAILHHLIENLDLVFERLNFWAKPGALMLFAEPVNFNQALRRLRFMIPVKTNATPDERPLERTELKIVRSFLPDLRMRIFSLLGRLDRFILVDYNYERSPCVRRALVNGIACIDYALLSLPVIENFGGTAVFYGHAPAAKQAHPRKST